MGHFNLLLVMPPRVNDPESRVERLIAPWAQDTEVPTHRGRCTCVLEKEDKVDSRYLSLESRRYGPIYRVRKTFLRRPDLKGCNAIKLRRLWAEFAHVAERKALRVKARLEQRGQLPDPDCEFCGGRGWEFETTNPNGIFDYWVIGGNFEGWLSKEVPPRHVVDPNTVTGRGLKERVSRDPTFAAYAFLGRDRKWRSEAHVEQDGPWEPGQRGLRRFKKLAMSVANADHCVMVDCHD